MPTERWRQVEQVFLEAVEQPAGLRRDFLARRCGPDADLRDEIVSLLAAVEQSGDFLSTPALDMFARQVSREGWSVKPGDVIGSYTIERRLGAGGMGEVWRARDDRLGRDVAIKLLLPNAANADERVRAFQREAHAASALNHTNVLTVYDVGEHDGAPYLVTECLEGEPLRARLGSGPRSVDAALDVALQVARGLGAAHARGIVHRDLKPENIFLADGGLVKILDFGLATLHDSVQPPASPSEGLSPEALRSLVAGTAGYMAPEQVRGEVVDARADIFALGAVLYEMLSGRRPFAGASTVETLSAVLNLPPLELSALSPETPSAVSRIVLACLAKSPDDRPATITEVASVLDAAIQARSRPVPPSWRGLLRRPIVMATVLLVVVAIGVGIWRFRVVTSRASWARTTAAVEAQRLLIQGDYGEAYLLVRQALEVLPDDPHLRQLWLDVSIPMAVRTEPAGADVAFRGYRNPTTSWFPLGRTPLDGARVPRGLFRVRISKAGFEPIEASGSPGALRYRLDPVGTAPPGMVHVVGRTAAPLGSVGPLDDFWIDRFEVTNRQFNEFVAQGGYRNPDYWREPFVEGGHSVPWEVALLRFRDATGQSGPATWTSGTYPDGQADIPVGGVSWYEASAYAAFAGKALPTLHHWRRAAGLGRFAGILAVSNFGGRGPAPVGSHAGLGPFGTYDMAGNVKEWCSTETDHERRFLLGGAWDEARYMFADFDARGPFERAPGYGFRTVKYGQPLPRGLVAPVPMEALGRDAQKSKPVGDDIFAVYRRQYAYDRTPLHAAIEATEETPVWVKHTVALDAAYGGERMRAYLFLPRNARPPYQTVIFFPGADAFILTSSREMSLAPGDFIIRSGRAFLYPVYKGSYERSVSDDLGANAEREIRIAWSRDLGRAIDYLETRTDIDGARLAFYGISTGADAGVFLTALEPRVKTSVLQGAGVPDEQPPEIDALNFAPRVRVPTLMLNGRYDFESPLETAQRPLFARLGSPAADKRHVVFESGHALPIADVAREILPWLDRYLGPVDASPAPR